MSMQTVTNDGQRTPLFLDVDGVLNVVPYTNHQGQWDDYVTEPVMTFGREFMLTISRKCCDALADLPVDIQWCTTWEDEANEKLSHLTGFDDYPVFARAVRSLSRRNWKLDAVANWYEDEGVKRFVWIDDDAIPGNAEQDFPEALLIRTRLNEGITPAHVEQIRNYVGAGA